MLKRSCFSMAVAALLGGPAAADPLLEYGAYLAGDCVTCHRADGADKGIPPIVGWHPEAFVAMLMAFKTGERDHEAMVAVARSLDQEQIKALAAYFATLKPKN